jgi:hypothetical protein
MAGLKKRFINGYQDQYLAEYIFEIIDGIIMRNKTGI